MKTHSYYTIACSMLLLGICLFIRYQIGRRRFSRRGIGGLQQFSSYGKAITVILLERLVLFIGSLCGGTGIILLALAAFHHLKF